MESNLNHLRTMVELEEALLRSESRPIIIFKHSTRCPISAWVQRELDAHLENAPDGVDYFRVVVQTERQLSSLIADRLGVRHATPQVLLIRNRESIWYASHLGITDLAIREAIAKQLASDQAGVGR